MSKEIATPQQIDRDLAERFREGRQNNYECAESGPQCDPCSGYCGRGCAAKGWPWSPSTSRDDAHEVLAQLTDEQWQKFTRHLVPGSVDMPEFAIEAMFRVGFSSTPAQIAEAVWRAVC